MKRVLAILFVFLLFFSVFRSLTNKGRLSFDYLMRVAEGVTVNLDLKEFTGCVSDIGNFFTNFAGQFPEFEADNVFDAIKSTAIYIKTFMEMFANFVSNIWKVGYLCATYPIRGIWSFINAFFQLLGIEIGDLPPSYRDGGWRPAEGSRGWR